MKFLRVLRRISLEFICYWVLTTLLFAGVTIWAVFYVGVQYANFVLGLLVSMMVVFTILRGFAGVFGFVETIPIYLSMILIIPLVLIGRKDLAECILGITLGGLLVAVITGSFLGTTVESVIEYAKRACLGVKTVYDNDGIEEKYYNVCLRN